VKNALGFLAWFMACFISAMPEAHAPQSLKVRNDYRVAEHFGCREVERVCKAKQRMEAVWNGTKRSTRMN